MSGIVSEGLWRWFKRAFWLLDVQMRQIQVKMLLLLLSIILKWVICSSMSLQSPMALVTNC